MRIKGMWRHVGKVGRSIQVLFHRLRGREIVHVLHIGKTGGTAIKWALRNHLRTGNRIIMLHPHEFTLPKVPAGEKVCFVLRDPIDRFISGFWTRKRLGRPRYHFPWSRKERIAFERFPTPGQLAEALFAPDPGVRNAAWFAMTGINHVRTHYRDWLVSKDYLERRSGDILFVGFLETLDQDFERLKQLLNLPAVVKLPDHDMEANRNPSKRDAALSAQGLQNLKTWYNDDYELLRYCREHILIDSTPKGGSGSV